MKKIKILALVMTCAILLSSLMILPVSATEQATTPTATNVMGKEITIDGKMSDGEGWSEDPLFYLDTHVQNPSNGSYTYQSNIPNPLSSLRISTDGDYLYIFFETANEYSLDKDTNNASNNLDLYFKREGTDLNSNTTEGVAFRLQVKLDADYITPDEGEEYKLWDHTNISSSHMVWRYSTNQGGTNATATMKENTHIAARINKTGDVVTSKTVEYKIPLAASLKAEMATGEVSYRISAFERTNYYDSNVNDDVALWTSQSNGGYIVGEWPMLTNSWKDIATAGVAINLPCLNEDSKTAPVLVGFQAKVNQDSTYDVRFVSVVEDYEGFDLNASKLGYNFTYGDKNDTKYCATVYETLNANGSEISASAFGGKYFFCFTIKGLSKTEANGYTFGVECFTQKDAEAAVETCAVPVTVKVVYNTTETDVDFIY